MSRSKQKKLLKLMKNCIQNNICDEFFKYNMAVIEKAIDRVCRKRNIILSKPDIEDLRQDVSFELCRNNYKRLRKYSEFKGMSLNSWIIYITGHTVWDKR